MEFLKKSMLISLVLFISLISGIVFSAGINDGASIRINQLQYDPFPAQSGKYLDLWMTVQNQSNNYSSDVSCELMTKYPFYLQPDENSIRNIGKMSPNSVATLRYKLIVSSDALNSDQEMDFRCKINEESDNWVTQKVIIQVKAIKPEFAIGTITTTPEKLTSDTTNNKINIEIQNIGNESAKLVTTQLILPKGFTSSKSYSDTYNLGNVSAETSKNAIYYLDIAKEIKAGKYPSKLIINYKYTANSTDNYKTQEIDFDLDVKPEPKFEIEEITINPKEIYSNTPVQIKIKLKNTGLEEAKAVSMKVYTQNDQPFDFDKKYDYMGDLKVGESGEIIFSLTTDSTAQAKKYLIKTEIRYLVGEEVKLSEEQFSIEILEKKNVDLTIFILAGVIIIAGVGFYLWKKKK